MWAWCMPTEHTAERCSGDLGGGGEQRTASLGASRAPRTLSSPLQSSPSSLAHQVRHLRRKTREIRQAAAGRRPTSTPPTATFPPPSFQAGVDSRVGGERGAHHARDVLLVLVQHIRDGGERETPVRDLMSAWAQLGMRARARARALASDPRRQVSCTYRTQRLGARDAHRSPEVGACCQPNQSTERASPTPPPTH
jgi:hypothetical protein